MNDCGGAAAARFVVVDDGVEVAVDVAEELDDLNAVLFGDGDDLLVLIVGGSEEDGGDAACDEGAETGLLIHGVFRAERDDEVHAVLREHLLDIGEDAEVVFVVAVRNDESDRADIARL